MLTIRLPERRNHRLGLTALTGATGVLCFAPFALFWLALPVWGLFFALLRRAETRREATLTGLSFGLGFFLTGVSWVYVSLSVCGGMPWWLAGVAAFLFCCVLALFPMLAGWAFKRWQPESFWQQALYFAALLGVHGLSLLVTLSGALLLTCWRLGLFVVATLAIGGFGLQQVDWTPPVGEPISVALVQGNVPQEMKFRPEAFIRTLDLYRELIRQNPAQLTVLPETAIPLFLDQIPGDYLDELKALAQRQNGDLIVGTLTGDGERYFNSAVSLGAAPMQVYSKSHLVPFGEFIPAGFAWFMAYANIPMSSFARGPEVQTPFVVAGQNVAANICYEDVFGEEIIRALPQAGILANLSNTAWFGHSLAQPQHLQIAQMRAAETGRPMLRATNTGMTAIINADGKVQAVLEPFATGVLNGEIRAHEGVTPYVCFGNGLALGLMLLFGLLGLALKRPVR